MNPIGVLRPVGPNGYVFETLGSEPIIKQVVEITCPYGHKWDVEKGWVCPECGAKGATPGSTGTRIYTK